MSAIEPSVPPIDQALVPPDVRAGGPKAEQTYSAALGFESLLVQELTSQLAQTAGLDGSSDDGSSDDGSDDGSDGGGLGTSPYASLLPGALADAITADGGLGLAPEIYRSLAQQPPGAASP